MANLLLSYPWERLGPSLRTMLPLSSLTILPIDIEDESVLVDLLSHTPHLTELAIRHAVRAISPRSIDGGAGLVARPLDEVPSLYRILTAEQGPGVLCPELQFIGIEVVQTSSIAIPYHILHFATARMQAGNRLRQLHIRTLLDYKTPSSDDGRLEHMSISSVTGQFWIPAAFVDSRCRMWINPEAERYCTLKGDDRPSYRPYYWS
ncbi:hypothetical protein C8Q74DRAFT_508151 [Fomes fomentarius]|nr:hypothetical protein C8Q74DRAFT_508151 [Fomes fomentarius]